jgi:hypothetical protein
MALISASLARLDAEIQAAADLDSLGRLSVAELTAFVARPLPPPVVVRVEVPKLIAAASAPAAAPPQASQQRAADAPQVPGAIDLAVESSAAREVASLRDSIQQLSDTNDRVMAQNIALLADLESAQKAVRELRADKDALALQLKRAMLSAAASNGSGGAAGF